MIGKRTILAVLAAAGLAITSAPPALAQPNSAKEQEQKEISWGEAREMLREYFREHGKRYRIRSTRREGDNYVIRVYDRRGLPKGRYAVNAKTGEIKRVKNR